MIPGFRTIASFSASQAREVSVTFKKLLSGAIVSVMVVLAFVFLAKFDRVAPEPSLVAVCSDVADSHCGADIFVDAVEALAPERCEAMFQRGVGSSYRLVISSGRGFRFFVAARGEDGAAVPITQIGTVTFRDPRGDIVSVVSPERPAELLAEAR